MNFLKKYKLYGVCTGLVISILIVVFGLHFMKNATLQKEYQVLQNKLVKEYVEDKKERVVSLITRMKERFHQEHKLVEESATYELK